MSTIAYDLSVKDLIAGLDATGHVTHTQHRKTHVTIHHNGGRFSHEGVLQIWQTRPASAQFDIDIVGDVAQYVRVAEYAWACGSTVGNVCSISIEMCNLTVGPDWLVSDATWKSTARLAGWLFARVIGYRPTREFLVQHKVWSATACAGPYIDRIYNQILELAQKWYDRFVFGDIVEGLEEDDMVYQVGPIAHKDGPDWMRVKVPPVKQSRPLPNNGTSCAWVDIDCPQKATKIWAVYQTYADGRSELIWGPGIDPRQMETSPSKEPVLLMPDARKQWQLTESGTTGLSILFEGPAPLTALVTLSPDGR